jgi:RNA polymerase sigma factor (sigma-70 family)
LTFRAGTEWDAEDVLHDAYERALKYASSFNGEGFGAWFSTILNNSLKEHKNASKGHYVSLDDIEEEGIPCPHYSDRMLKEVYQLIKAKTPAQQEILFLYMKNNYTAVDVSRITNYTYSNCHQTIRRFREEIKERYMN